MKFSEYILGLSRIHKKMIIKASRQCGKTTFIKQFYVLNKIKDEYMKIGIMGTTSVIRESLSELNGVVIVKPGNIPSGLDVLLIDEAAWIKRFSSSEILNCNVERIYILSSVNKEEKEFRCLYEDKNDFFKMSISFPNETVKEYLSPEDYEAEYIGNWS